MMKTADNKKPPIRINSVVFAIMWALSYAVGVGAAYLLALAVFNLEPQVEVSLWQILGAQFTLITTMGVVSGSIQRFAMWLRFGRKLTWWRRTSIIGWWLGGLAFLAFSWIFARLNIPDFNRLWLVVPQAISMLTPVALMQWLVLRRHVDKAWLYVLATVSSATVLATLLIAVRDLFSMSVALAASTLVIAYTLTWLFSMSGSVAPKQETSPDTSRLTTPDADERDTTSSPDAETEAQLMEKLD